MSATGCLARRGLLAAAILALGAAARAQEFDHSKAIDPLAREKALAEGCAAILKRFGGDDLMARVQGQRGYGRAKAEADRLIAQLILDLAAPRSPAESPTVQASLRAVPIKRHAFCAHVVDSVWPLPDAGVSSVQLDLLATGAGSQDSLVGTADAIWRAYQAGGNGRRAAIETHIETTRWLPYADIPAR